MPQPINPSGKPKLGYADVLKIINEHHINEPVKIVGIRGYYKTTMGNPVTNDRGLYDDALFVVADDAFVSFNANTDPTLFKKHTATLKTGVWKYKEGKHGLSKPKPYTPYWALVQAAPVTVARDLEKDDTGYFGINIHRGGFTTTGSEGCQTIYPDQWESFISLVYSLLKKYDQQELSYILVEN